MNQCRPALCAAQSPARNLARLDQNRARRPARIRTQCNKGAIFEPKLAINNTLPELEYLVALEFRIRDSQAPGCFVKQPVVIRPGPV